MNQDVEGNRKLFWKQVSKVSSGKLEGCNRIKDGNGRLALKRMNYERYGRIILRTYIM